MQGWKNGRGKRADDAAMHGDSGADARDVGRQDTTTSVLETFPPPPPGKTESVPFATFCDLLEALADERRHARKVEMLRDFREKYLTVREFFFLSFLFREVSRRGRGENTHVLLLQNNNNK